MGTIFLVVGFVIDISKDTHLHKFIIIFILLCELSRLTLHANLDVADFIIGKHRSEHIE